MISLIGTIKYMNDDDLKNLWISDPLTDREIKRIETIQRKTADSSLYQKGIVRYHEDGEVVKVNLLGRFKLLLDARNGDAFSIKMSTLDFWRMAEPNSNAKYLRNQKSLVKLVAAKNAANKINCKSFETANRTRASKKIGDSAKQFKSRVELLKDLKALNYR